MSFDFEAVKINLDSSAFEKEIEALYKNPAISELKVKARLTAASVTALIKSFDTVKASVKVDAVLVNLQTLQTALDKLEGKITVDAILDFAKAASQLEEYKPTKTIEIATELEKTSFAAVKKEVESFLKPVFKTINLVLNQDSYQTSYDAIVASLADTKKLPRKVDVDVNVKVNGQSQIDDLVKSASEDLDVYTNVKAQTTELVEFNLELAEIGELNRAVTLKVTTQDAELKTVINDLARLTSITHTSKLKVDVDSTELTNLQTTVKSLQDKTETVSLKADLDNASASDIKTKLDNLSGDRTVTIRTKVEGGQIEGADVISKTLDKDVAYQVKKLFNKVDKGIKMASPEVEAAYKPKTYSDHADELNQILSILNKIDNVDLFNEAVTKIAKVRDILAKMPGTEFQHEIPAYKQQKQTKAGTDPVDELASGYKNAVIEVPVKAVLDPTSLAEVKKEIEAAAVRISVTTELDLASLGSAVDRVVQEEATLTTEVEIDPASLKTVVDKIETETASLKVVAELDPDSLKAVVSRVESEEATLTAHVETDKESLSTTVTKIEQESPTIQIKTTLEPTSLAKTVETVNAKKASIKVESEVDPESLTAAITEIESKTPVVAIKTKLDSESLANEIATVGSANATLSLKTKVDSQSLTEAKAEVEAGADVAIAVDKTQIERAKTEVDALKHAAKSVDLTIEVEPSSLSSAQTKLDLLTADRTVTIQTKVEGKQVGGADILSEKLDDDVAFKVKKLFDKVDKGIKMASPEIDSAYKPKTYGDHADELKEILSILNKIDDIDLFNEAVTKISKVRDILTSMPGGEFTHEIPAYKQKKTTGSSVKDTLTNSYRDIEIAIPVKAVLDKPSLEAAIAYIESQEASVTIFTDVDDVSATKAVKQIEDNTVAIPIQVGLDPVVLAASLDQLESQIESRLTALKNFITQSLQTAIKDGLSSSTAKAITTPTLDFEINVIGLDGVTQLLNSFKELGDFGTLKVNAELDELTKKSEVVSAQVKSAQAYNIFLALQIKDLDETELNNRIKAVQDQLEKIPVYLALALAEDTKTLLNSAIAAISLDPKQVELGIDCKELHKRINDCIENVDKEFVTLGVRLNTGLVKNQVAKIRDYINKQQAAIQVALNDSEIMSQLSKVIQDVEASRALLPLALNDSRFQDELEALKARIEEDFVKLQVQIEGLDIGNAAEDVGKEIAAEVQEAIKKFSAEELAGFEQKNRTAKGQLTKLGKPNKIENESVINQRDGLVEIAKQLEGSNEEALLSKINESISRLNAELTKRGVDDLSFSAEIDNAQAEFWAKFNQAQAKKGKAQASSEFIQSQIQPVEKPKTHTAADYFANSGMDASENIVELAKGIAKIVAKLKGLDDVWDDKMLPQLFAKGNPRMPSAKGSAFDDSSAIVLGASVAEGLEDVSKIAKDALVTLTHEITHIMQNLADKLGRDPQYSAHPQTTEEMVAVRGVESSKVYQEANAKDGGKTFKREIDSNLTPLRALDLLVDELGLTITETKSPTEKATDSLRNMGVAIQHSAKLAENFARINGDKLGKEVYKSLLANYMEFMDTMEAQGKSASYYAKLFDAGAGDGLGAMAMSAEMDDSNPWDSERKDARQEAADNATLDEIEGAIKQHYQNLAKLDEQRKGKMSKAAKEDLAAQKQIIAEEILLLKNSAKIKRSRGEKLTSEMEVKKTVIQNQGSDEVEAGKVAELNQKIALLLATIRGVQQRTADNSSYKQSQTSKVDAQTDEIKAGTVRKDNKSAADILTQKQKAESERLLKAQKLQTQEALAEVLIAKQKTALDIEQLKKIKQTDANRIQVQKAIKDLEAKQLKNQQLLTQLSKLKVDLQVAQNTAETRVQREFLKTNEQRLKNLKLEAEIASKRSGSQTTKGSAPGSTIGGGSTGISTDTTGMTAPVVTAETVKASSKQLAAIRKQATDALAHASRLTSQNASQEELAAADLDAQEKLYRVRLVEVRLAREKLELAVRNAKSADNVEQSILAVEYARLRNKKAEQNLAEAQLKVARKQQMIDAANLKAVNAAAKASGKNTANRSYGASGGSKSQVNAERRLPINLGLNILEASNNRLGNLARVFVDLTEGIHGASLAGESFGQTLNRIKMPIAVIGVVGAMASLAAITAPAALAVQKLEKSLTAFGKQNEFAAAMETSKDLALNYGVSLKTAAGELSRFKTSLADSSIATDADSIFASLGKYGTTVGATQDELSRGYVALGQIASKGKVSLEELNGQLSEAIPGASSIAAKALGITKKELFETAAAGSLLSDEFLPKFRDELNRVNEAQEIFGKETLSTAFGRVKESLTLLGIEQTQAGLNLLAGGFSKLADWLKAGLEDPIDGTTKKLINFSFILNKMVIAGAVFLGNTLIRFLAPKLAATWIQLNLLTTGLYRNARGLQTSSAASQMAVMNFTKLSVALKGLAASVLPMLAAFALLDAVFKVFSEANGGVVFDSLNKEMEETANNISKLKDKILKDFKAIKDGKPDFGRDPENDFLDDIQAPNVSREEKQRFADEYDSANWWDKTAMHGGTVVERLNEEARLKKDKVGYSQEIMTSEHIPREIVIEQRIVQANSKITKSAQETAKNLEAVNNEVAAFVNNEVEIAELTSQVAERNKLNEMISDMGLLIQSFNNGAISSKYLKMLLAELSIPKDLIPAELGTGLGGATKEANDLNEILGILKFRQGELNETIESYSPESIQQVIDEAKKDREGLEKTSAEYKKHSKIILEQTVNLEKLNQVLGKQKIQLDFVNKALMAYNSLKSEQEGRVDQAALLSKVLLKEEALNKGLIKRGDLENQLTRIQAKSHTEKMSDYKKQKKALNELTKNVRKSDAFQAALIIKKPELFSKQSNGTFSFKVDRASVAELDLLLNSPVANFSDTFRKAIETAKTDMQGIGTGYLTEYDALQDLEFQVREKAAEVEKETEDTLKDINKDLEKHTKDFVTSFVDAINAINEEIKGIETQLKTLKLTNAGKAFNNAIEKFANEADGEIDNTVLDNLRLRFEQGVENSIADIEFESESDRIASAFASGVNEIQKAFADYLEEFKKLQQDLIKARQEQAKAKREKEEAERALKGDSSISPNLKVFGLSKSELNQGIGKSIIDNPIPDSEELMNAAQEVGEESKKQTEQSNAQLAGQDRANVLAAAQIDTVGMGTNTIVDALQNQSFDSNIDFTGMDVFQSILGVLLQVRDLLGTGAVGGGMQGQMLEEPKEVRRSRASVNELKGAYEKRDALIAKLNSAQNDFNKDDSDLKAAQTFEETAEAIAQTEITIMNRERELQALGHKIDQPLQLEDRTQIGTISDTKRVAISKNGMGIFNNYDKQALTQAQQNPQYDPVKLEERQNKYNNRAGMLRSELVQLKKFTKRSEQDLINMPRAEIEKLAQSVNLTLKPLERLATEIPTVDGTLAQPEQTGTPPQIKALAQQMGADPYSGHFGQVGQGIPEEASQQVLGNYDDITSSQTDLTDAVISLEQTMSDPIIANNSELTQKGKDRRKAEETKAKRAEELNKEDRFGKKLDSEAKDNAIAKNTKDQATLAGAKAIEEALKPKEAPYLTQAKTNTKDEATRLEALKDALKPAEDQIATLKNTISQLEDKGSALYESTSELALAQGFDPEQVVAEQIGVGKQSIATLENDPNLKAAQKAREEEEKRYAALVKSEEILLRMTGEYNKQVDKAGLKNEQERVKQILEDPNIHPEDSIKGKRREKRLEQQITFGDRTEDRARAIFAAGGAKDLTEAAKIATAELMKLDAVDMQNLEASLDTVVNKLKGSVREAMVGIFSIDFTDKSKSFSEKIFGLFDGILKNLQSWAANKLGDVLMSALNPGSSDKAGQTLNSPQGSIQPQQAAQGINEVVKAFATGGADGGRRKEWNDSQKGAKAFAEYDAKNQEANVDSTEALEKSASSLDSATDSLKQPANMQVPTINLGQGLGQSAANVGVAALGQFGGTYGQIASSILGAFMADGGEVGKSMGAESAIAQMMQKERIMSNGKQPILAALHLNEQVLTTKNKDAQAFRAMQSSGVWDAMKSSAGFASGGSVGNPTAMKTMLMNKTSNTQSKTITSINNFNFSATNDKLIKRTENQIKNRKDQFLN